MAGIEISTFFTLADTNPLYVVEDKFIRGGCRIVTDIAARDELLTKIYHIKAGMLVVTQNDNKLWQLGTDLLTWTELLNQYTLPIASTTQLGGVKVDGTSITISNGFISSTSYTLPNASNLTLGGVKVGNGLSIDGNGVLSTNAINILTPTNFFIGSCAPGAFEPIDNKIYLAGQTVSILSKVCQQRGPITSLDVVLQFGTVYVDFTGEVRVNIDGIEYITTFEAFTTDTPNILRHNVITFPVLDIFTYYYVTVIINGADPLDSSTWYVRGILAS